ncbi:MAG: leucine-rich repeat protein [Bacteroidales bacterium]
MKKSILIILTLIFGISLNAKAEDFSAVYSSNVIYYNITSSSFPYTAEVTFRGLTYSSYSNEYLIEVSIPDSVLYSGNYYKVTSIGYSAFRDCVGVIGITIPSSVSSIGNSAFRDCISINTLFFNAKNCNAVGTNTEQPFYGCNGLNKIIIGDGVISIPENAFNGINLPASTTIPSSVTSIGASAFKHWSNLTSITIPSSVTSIGDNAFSYCTGLDTLFFNATNCNDLGINTAQPFYGCDSLNTLIIGDGVISIPENAFYGLYRLSSITSKSINPPSVQSSSFTSVNKSIPFYVPCYSVLDYQSAVNLSAFTNYIGVTASTFISDTICQGDIYNSFGFDFIANTSGLYTQTIQTIHGCDSIVSLNLIVKHVIPPSGLSLHSAANSIELDWAGNPATFIIFRDNDFLATLTTKVYRDTTVVEGISYCYKLKAIRDGCESEFCPQQCYTHASFNDVENNKITTKLYPNPADNKAILEVDGLTSVADVVIYDIYSRAINTYRIDPSKKDLEIDVRGLSKGIYTIKIISQNVNQTQKLIVR